MSRASSDVALLQGMLSFLPITAGNLVMLVVSLVVMLILSPPLTRRGAGHGARDARASRSACGTKVFPATWDAQQRAGEVAEVVDEAVTGVRVVKGFGQEDRELDRSHRRRPAACTDRGSGNVRVQARYTPRCRRFPCSRRSRPWPSAVGWPSTGRITLGTFLAFSSYLVQLVAPVRMMAALIAVGQQARAGAERVLESARLQPPRRRPG